MTTELQAYLTDQYWMNGWGLPWMACVVAITWWLIVDVKRRGRGWIRWGLLSMLLWPPTVAVWLWRRRRWPVSAVLDRRTKFGLAGIALAAHIVQIGVATSIGYNFRTARVEGAAMGQTINNQDRLLVNKAVYRGRDPVHGDIIMHRYPRDPEKSFVKRVIGVGGDELRIEDGIVFRNGTKLDEPYVHEAGRSAEDMAPQQIPPGFYFVMGDRRNNSSDSRHWGLVPREYVLGRVTRRWWPISEARTFE